MSHNCLVYLDDDIFGHLDHVSSRACSLIPRSDLSSAGLVHNESTSCWESVQMGTWLSIVINIIQHIFQVPHH